MSYAANTKSKLVKAVSVSELAEKALVSAIIRTAGELKLGNAGQLAFIIVTENAAVARFVLAELKNKYQLDVDLIIKRNRSLKKHNIYEVQASAARAFFKEMGILDTRGGLAIVNDIPPFVYQSEDSMRAYLKGLFLGCGSISDPEVDYHFELLAQTESFGKKIINLMEHFNLRPKMIKRKNNYVIYLKESQQIVDVLSVIGAFNALLNYENIRVVKSVRNRTNRMVNCDTANLKKMMKTAERQNAAIDLIEHEMGLSSLSEALLEVALLRRDYPEMSLSELGQMLTPPISKSGVNHRLKKIELIAQELKEGKDAETQ